MTLQQIINSKSDNSNQGELAGEAPQWIKPSTEDVPNGTSIGLSVPEDTGRIEERMGQSKVKHGIPSDVKNILNHFRNVSQGSENDMFAPGEIEEQKEQQQRKDEREREEQKSASSVQFEQKEEDQSMPQSQQSPLQQQSRSQSLASFRKHLLPHFANDGSKIEDFQSKLKFSSRFLKPFHKKQNEQQVSEDQKKKLITMSQRDIEQQLLKKNDQKIRFTVDSLIAGYPSALYASSYFLNDEHGVRKPPLLMSQISVYITPVRRSQKTKRKRFRFHLEYGIGSGRLKWTVTRDLKQIAGLHNKLKVLSIQSNMISGATSRKELKLPRFPKPSSNHKFSSGLEKLATRHSMNNNNANNNNNNNEAHKQTEPHTGGATTATSRSLSPYDSDSALPLNSEVASSSLSRSLSSSSGSSISSTLSDIANWRHAFFRMNHLDGEKKKRKTYVDKLQAYFDSLIKDLLLRPEATRVFQFFELSPMSILLDNEMSGKKKEGYLFIKTTAKAQGWRVGHLKYRDFKAMVVRHTAKWFILGHSYIMYVSDINSTTPLDVFLVDPSFKITLSGLSDISSKSENLVEYMKQQLQKDEYSDDDDDDDSEDEDDIYDKQTRYFSMTLENSERKLSVMSKSAKELRSWYLSVYEMQAGIEWSKPHRFDSFAPIRQNCFAQWFVDARDYMWAASSAIEMAKDVIFIHDWWLTPELYMRRPPEGNQEWRIDRLLKRKAEQGVKIFIIVYRNVGNTVVTDSLWTKHSLLDLHPNIHVMRSPNQLMQNVYFWAHHEKLLVIDQSVCFVGGIDLCFGRWDTPAHTLIDDSPYTFASNVPDSLKQKHTHIKYQIFPGKDYSNPRVHDFFNLQLPFQDMYDRQITPRMPWHDVHMVTCGQVARDLSRHFVQRWNYLLRQKRPSRPTPLLIPPRNFTNDELEKFGFTGTCEIQLLRSSCFWSLGLQKHEQSIQNAYIKCIEASEHFVYIENQFFITSCEVDGVMILNRIGDALVERIIRAHREHQTWRAVIMIPLLPGFASEVDLQEGSSVRLITRCQYLSISTGESSIFGKLRKVGIVPEDYIQFYSLRRWGMIGPKKLLVTEQLYIHAKVMIVDDRIAIIGSANINERSMRGTRDSEVCAIVRDKNMINSHMDGKHYKVGNFSHTLRMRLMREHLGVNIDLLDLVERRFAQIESFAGTKDGILASTLGEDESGSHKLSAMVELGTRYLLDEPYGTETFKSEHTSESEGGSKLTSKMLKELCGKRSDAITEKKLNDIELIYSFNHRAGKENVGIRDKKPFSTDSRVTTPKHRKDVLGYGKDSYQSDSYISSKARVNKFMKEMSKSATANSPLPNYEDVMEFLNFNDKNQTVDEMNRSRWLMLKRLFYLQKFECKRRMDEKDDESIQPDTGSSSTSVPTAGIPHPSLPSTSLSDAEINEIDKNILPQTVSDFIDPYSFEDPLDINFFEGTWMPQAIRNTMIYQLVFHVQPDDSVVSWKEYKQFQEMRHAFMEHQKISRGYNGSIPDPESELFPENGPETPTNSTPQDNGDPHPKHYSGSPDNGEDNERKTLRRARMAALDRFQRNDGLTGVMGQISMGTGPNGEPIHLGVYNYDTAKKLLRLIKGRVVKFPARWLKNEVEGSNWFYKSDKLPPIQIWD